MPNQLPLLTAVICTRNRARSINDAVGSVLGNRDANFELLVIDQSDTDDTRTELLRFAGDRRLRYFHSKVPGLSAAYNKASFEGLGTLFAFTDDDCIAPPDWISRVRAAFQDNPEVELIYGQVCAPNYSTADGDVIPELRFSRERRLSEHDGFAIVGMGANFALRRAALKRLGGFDEVLGGGGPLRSAQDYDLQFRLFRDAGVSLLAPSISIEHHGLRTLKEWPATLSAYGVGDGGFYMKHVRCGDVLAAKLLAINLLRECGRTVLHPIFRRRRHSTAYLKGLLGGMCQSFHFRVDRKLRLYVPR